MFYLYLPFFLVNSFQIPDPGVVTLVNQWPLHSNPEQLTYAFLTGAFPENKIFENKNCCSSFWESLSKKNTTIPYH